MGKANIFAIEYINNAENKFSDLINLETGIVKIGVSTNLTKEYLMPYLKKFHEKYPKITVEIITDKSDNLYIKLSKYSLSRTIDSLAKQTHPALQNEPNNVVLPISVAQLEKDKNKSCLL